MYFYSERVLARGFYGEKTGLYRNYEVFLCATFAVVASGECGDIYSRCWWIQGYGYHSLNSVD